MHTLREWNDWATAVVRLGKLLDKGMWSAGNEREFDVVPVFTDGVVHDGPALQQRLFVGLTGKDDAIGGFPDGDFADVTDVKVAITGAGGGKGHAANVLIARGGDESEVAADFELEVGVEDVDGSGGIEINAANFSCVGDERDFLGFDGEGGAGASLAFDAEELAGDGGSCAAADFDASAAEGAEKFGLGWFFAESEAKCGQAAGQRGFGIVINAGDAATGQVEHGEGIQDVVELGAGEVNVDVLAAVDGAEMLKKADAVLVKDDAANGELGGRRKCG